MPGARQHGVPESRTRGPGEAHRSWLWECGSMQISGSQRAAIQEALHLGAGSTHHHSQGTGPRSPSGSGPEETTHALVSRSLQWLSSPSPTQKDRVPTSVGRVLHSMTVRHPLDDPRLLFKHIQLLGNFHQPAHRHSRAGGDHSHPEWSKTWAPRIALRHALLTSAAGWRPAASHLPPGALHVGL